MTASSTVQSTRHAGGHPTAERASEINGAVVAATLRAFAEQGADFSMDRVALLAGVSKQAIYRRWKGKTDLIIEAIDSVLTKGLAEPDGNDGDPVAVLRALAWQMFDTDLGESYRVNIFLQALSLRDDRIQGRMVGWRNRFLETYERQLRAIEQDGRRVLDDMSFQAEILLELLSAASTMLVLTGGIADDDKRRVFEERWQVFRRIAIVDPDGAT